MDTLNFLDLNLIRLRLLGEILAGLLLDEPSLSQ